MTPCLLKNQTTDQNMVKEQQSSQIKTNDKPAYLDKKKLAINKRNQKPCLI